MVAQGTQFRRPDHQDDVVAIETMRDCVDLRVGYL